MSTIKIRFVGRFVFTVSAKSPAELKVIAIDPSRVSSIGSAPHNIFATALKSQIEPKTDSRRPDFDLMVPINGVDADAMEQAVWNLVGCEASVAGDGFSWREQPSQEDLPNLRRFGGTGKIVDSGDKVSAIVRITTGVGYPVSLKIRVVSTFVPFGSPDTPTPNAPTGHLADMIEVELKDTAAIRIEVKGRGGSGTPSAICIRAVNPGETAVISFSNVCGHVPHVGADKEFAALYEVLETPPPMAERLIPMPAGSHPFNDIPCYNAAYVSDS